MAFTPADGGAGPPPPALQTAGDLPFAEQHQNLAQHVHQVQSISRPSHNNPPEIQNVLGPTGNTSKSITSSTSHSISDRHKKSSKSRKNNKSSSWFLYPYRSASETGFSATSGTPFQPRASSASHPSSNRSESTSKTEKKFQSNSRSSSPSRSESEAAILLTGNGAGQQLHPTAHQPFSDLPPSSSGTYVDEQLQPKSRHASITTAAPVHGLAGANLVPNLASPSPVATGTNDTSLLSASPRSDVFTVAARATGHDGASSSAGAAESAANELERLPAKTTAAVQLDEQLQSKPRHDVLSTAASTPSRVRTLEAGACVQDHAGVTLLPELAPSAPDPAVQPSDPPALTNAAKGKETQQLRPALINKTSHNPNPVPSIQTRILDPKIRPESQAQTRRLTHILTHNITQTRDPSTATQTQTRDPLTQAQTQNKNQNHAPSTQTQTQTHDPPTQNLQPKAQHPAHNSTPNFNPTQIFAETSFNPSKISYASIITPTSTSYPNAPPHPQQSFSDVVSGQKDSTIPLKSVSLMQGEPAVIFSAEEIAVMAEPFKLTLIGKFSFGRPSMDIIRKFFISLGLQGTSQISLLDNRHILIKLSSEDDYSRIWVRQSWYVNGRGMRIFKWSKDFRCSAESPIVPVWVSLPYLPVHFIYCKAALYSIATAIGTPLRVDNATASGNRPSVARILVEYDVSQPLLPRIWIGDGDSGFWQDVVFERVPAYCSSCRHLGHSSESCFITNPGLRKAPQSAAPSQRPATDRSAQPAASADEHQRQVPTTQSSGFPDFRPLGVTGISSHPLGREGVHTASDMPQDAHVDDLCLLGPPALRDIPHTPDMTPAPSSLAIQIVESGSPITMLLPIGVDPPDAAPAPDTSDIPPGDIDTTVVSFNTHCTDFPSSEETGDGVQSSDGDETRVDEEISDGAVIENFGDQRTIRCSEGFIEVTPRKNFNIKPRRRRRNY